MRPNGELPSDHYADRRRHTPEARGGAKNGLSLRTKNRQQNQKQPLDRKSPIQVCKLSVPRGQSRRNPKLRRKSRPYAGQAAECRRPAARPAALPASAGKIGHVQTPSASNPDLNRMPATGAVVAKDDIVMLLCALAIGFAGVRATLSHFRRSPGHNVSREMVLARPALDRMKAPLAFERLEIGSHGSTRLGTGGWIPHSVFARPRQRPARSSSLGQTRSVQVMHPIER